MRLILVMIFLLTGALAVANVPVDISVSGVWSGAEIIQTTTLPCDGGAVVRLEELGQWKLTEVNYYWARGDPAEESLWKEGRLVEEFWSRHGFVPVKIADGRDFGRPTLTEDEILILPWSKDLARLELKFGCSLSASADEEISLKLVPVGTASVINPAFRGEDDVGLSLATSTGGGIYIPAADVNGDGKVDILDVQLAINAALGVINLSKADINGDGKVDILDVQLAINAALSLPIGESVKLMTAITPNGSGNILPAGGRYYLSGSRLDFQAEPQRGYVFQSWVGLPNQGDNPQTVVIDRDMIVQANFRLLPPVVSPRLEFVYNENLPGKMSVLLDLRSFLETPDLKRFGTTAGFESLDRLGLLLSEAGAKAKSGTGKKIWEDYRVQASAETPVIARIFTGIGVNESGQPDSLSLNQSDQVSAFPYVMMAGDSHRYYLVNPTSLSVDLNGLAVTSGPNGYLVDLPSTRMPLVIVGQSPSRVEVNTGSPVRLFVQATGKPPLSYGWEKDGTGLPGLGSYELLIPHAKVSDSGLYRCLVTDGYTKSLFATTSPH